MIVYPVSIVYVYLVEGRIGQNFADFSIKKIGVAKELLTIWDCELQGCCFMCGSERPRAA